MAERRIVVAVAHDAGLSGRWVAEHVPREDGIEVAEVTDSLSPRSHAMQTSDADVLVVACSDDFDGAIELVEWWVGHRARHPVIVLCRDSANGFVQRAFAAGADDLVVLEPGGDISPATARSLAFAVNKSVLRRLPPVDNAAKSATMISVLGPKGGVGKTVTACNLAVSLASSHKVVLVDLNLQFGDVALALGLSPERTAYGLATSGGSLDADKVDAYLVVHPIGLRVLVAPVGPDQIGHVTAEFITEVIATLRTRYEYVIVDTPPTFTPEVIAAIDASTYVCMVGMLDALSLKNTRLGLETLELMGYPSDRVRVVLGRANASVGITGQDVVNTLRREPDILVPSSRDVTRSINEGEPIVLSQKRSEAARAFNALAALFSQRAATKDRIRNLPRRSRS